MGSWFEVFQAIMVTCPQDSRTYRKAEHGGKEFLMEQSHVCMVAIEQKESHKGEILMQPSKALPP